MVSHQLQSHIKAKDSSLEELDYLRNQVIDKDSRVEELLLDLAAVAERHANDVDEIAETSVKEISELEDKLESEQDKLESTKLQHLEEIANLQASNDQQVKALKAELKALQERLDNASEQRLEASAQEDGTTQVLLKFQEQLLRKDQELSTLQAVSKKKYAEFEKQLAT